MDGAGLRGTRRTGLATQKTPTPEDAGAKSGPVGQSTLLANGGLDHQAGAPATGAYAQHTLLATEITFLAHGNLHISSYLATLRGRHGSNRQNHPADTQSRRERGLYPAPVKKASLFPLKTRKANASALCGTYRPRESALIVPVTECARFRRTTSTTRKTDWQTGREVSRRVGDHGDLPEKALRIRHAHGILDPAR